MMIGRRILNQGYGKLLLKTISTKSDWALSLYNTNRDTKWTFVDNATKQVIDKGIIPANTNYNLHADLSTNTGEAILYIDVDDNGNGIRNLNAWFYSADITFLDLSVIPELYSLYLINGTTVTCDFDSLEINNLTFINSYNSKFANADFINNAIELYRLSLYGATSLNNEVIQLSDKSKLHELSIHSSAERFKIDTNDFRLYNNLSWARLDLDNSNGERILYFKTDKIQYISLQGTNAKLPQLQTETFTELTELWLNDINNSDTIPINDLVKNRLPKLKKINLNYTVNLDTRDLLIENNTLEQLYIKCGNIDSLTVNNCQKLLWLYNSDGCSNTSLILDEISQSNLDKVFLRSNHVSEIDLSKSYNLRLMYINNTNYSKLNIKNGNNHNLIDLGVWSDHTDYNDACIIVDDPTLPIFTNHTFRDGDTITDDETSCPT